MASGLTTGKTVGRGASIAISAKTGTAETTVDEGKQANTNGGTCTIESKDW